jgi:hypothetical protein
MDEQHLQVHKFCAPKNVQLKKRERDRLNLFAVKLLCKVTKFLVPDWGDIIDSGIGLSYRTARLHRLAGRYEKVVP